MTLTVKEYTWAVLLVADPGCIVSGHCSLSADLATITNGPSDDPRAALRDKTLPIFHKIPTPSLRGFYVQVSICSHLASSVQEGSRDATVEAKLS